MLTLRRSQNQDAFSHASRSRRYEILQILNDDPRSAYVLDIRDWDEEEV
jgi:hypothetical protein